VLLPAIEHALNLLEPVTICNGKRFAEPLA
jgi:hypothetical protein